MKATRKAAAARAQLAFSIFEDTGEPSGVLARREPPSEFRIFAFGDNTALKDPGTFLFDEVSAVSVMETFKQQKRGFLSFDYEHGAAIGDGTLKPSGGRWVPEIRNGELWATQIQWTAAAYEAIASREVELFSPWFTHEPEAPYRVLTILNCALTNTPALYGAMPLIAASTATGTGDDMDKDKEIEELKAALAKASEEAEELRASVASLTSKLAANADEDEDEEKEEEVKAALSLRTSIVAVTGKASIPAALGVLEAWKSKASVADKLTAEHEASKTAKLSADFDDVLEKAREALVPVAVVSDIRAKALKFGGGKVTESALEFATLALSVAPQLSSEVTEQPRGKVSGILSDRQKKMALSMGKDPEKFAAFKAKHFLGAQ